MVSDLPLTVESKKLAPRFVGPYVIESIGPYVIESIVNPCAVRLKVPSFVFTPLFVSPRLSLSPPEPAPPLQMIDDHPAYTARRLLDVRHLGRGV